MSHDQYIHLSCSNSPSYHSFYSYNYLFNFSWRSTSSWNRKFSWVSVSLHPSNEHFIFYLLGDLCSLLISGGSAERITSGKAFNSQAEISPSAEKITFISDCNGKNNLWIADIDGRNPIQLSDDPYTHMLSPAWTTDSNYVMITERGKEIELNQHHIAGGIVESHYI